MKLSTYFCTLATKLLHEVSLAQQELTNKCLATRNIAILSDDTQHKIL